MVQNMTTLNIEVIHAEQYPSTKAGWRGAIEKHLTNATRQQSLGKVRKGEN